MHDCKSLAGTGFKRSTDPFGEMSCILPQQHRKVISWQGSTAHRCIPAPPGNPGLNVFSTLRGVHQPQGPVKYLASTICRPQIRFKHCHDAFEQPLWRILREHAHLHQLLFQAQNLPSLIELLKVLPGMPQPRVQQQIVELDELYEGIHPPDLSGRTSAIMRSFTIHKKQSLDLTSRSAE